MASIFSRIVKGEIPCYKIAEDDLHLAFLDIFPLTEGHTLVIPKKETDYIFDLSQEEFAALSAFAHKVGNAVQRATNCNRVCTAVAGYEVPHAHIHLIPTMRMSDMNFANPKLSLSQEQFQAIAERIRTQITG